VTREERHIKDGLFLQRVYHQAGNTEVMCKSTHMLIHQCRTLGGLWVMAAAVMVTERKKRN
jgi:hypothetical protein